MVIVFVSGGMGNQLFHYAFAKVVEQRLGAAVYLIDKIDTAAHGRRWELNNFNISLDTKSASWLMNLKLLKKFLYSITGQLTRKPFIYVYIDANDPLAENCKTFDQSKFDDFFSPSYRNQATHLFDFIDRLDPLRDYIIRGYWWYAALANNIESLLRKDLSFANAPTRSTNRILEQIRMADNPVAIHMRTDWYSDAIRRPPIHPQLTLDISYYQKAIETMRHQLNSPQFFVFADNIQRASTLLAGLDPSNETFYYVDSSDRLVWEDMFLMHHCKHFVLSNSTFGWWGCWLAGDKIGITIMPDNWDGYNRGCLVSDGLEISKDTIRL